MNRMERLHATLMGLNTEWNDTISRVDSIAVFDSVAGRGFARVIDLAGNLVKLPFTVDSADVVTFHGGRLAMVQD